MHFQTKVLLIAFWRLALNSYILNKPYIIIESISNFKYARKIPWWKDT